jgi:hypothetical protein
MASPKGYQIGLIDVWESIRRGLRLVGQEGLAYDYGQTHQFQGPIVNRRSW